MMPRVMIARFAETISCSFLPDTRAAAPDTMHEKEVGGNFLREHPEGTRPPQTPRYSCGRLRAPEYQLAQRALQIAEGSHMVYVQPEPNECLRDIGIDADNAAACA
jgi:hypothetical protein